MMKDLMKGNFIMQHMSLGANKTLNYLSYIVPESYAITYKHIYLLNDNINYKLTINFNRIKQFFIVQIHIHDQ